MLEKNFMKRSIFALVLTFTLVACSGGEQQSTSSDSFSQTEFQENLTVIEETATINPDSEYALEGTLLIPQGAQNPVPAAVLVHGSGQNDRDETIYNNKPFKDIAEYLASKGIAVLRYDKRTYIHATKMAQNISELTVKEETIDDAIAATDILKADKRFDPEKIFIIGHSMGGILAPRIDAEGGDYAGIIILAGSPRFYSEIYYDQYMAAVETLTGNEKQKALAQHEEIMNIFDSLDNMTDEEAKQIVIGGATGYYFKEWDAHPAADYLTELTKPIYILQGDKDFQVYPDKDYAAYQELLKGKDNVTFKLYPGLNHFFMTSTGDDFEGYKIASHVDEQVSEDIARFILEN
jgi:dienelactone hydrolase